MSMGVQRASTQDKHMTEDHLFQVMCHHGCMPTRKEITEMMAHFDGNRDGKIDLQELACELLQLPRPSAVSHINPFYSERPPVSAATRRLVQRLSIACERSAAPPSRIYNVFRQFDKVLCTLDGMCMLWWAMVTAIVDIGSGRMVLAQSHTMRWR